MPELPETINLSDGLLIDLLETAAEAINESTTTCAHQVPAETVEWLKTVIATHPDAQVREWALNELAKKLPGVTK